MILGISHMNNGESLMMQSGEATLGESRGTHNRK